MSETWQDLLLRDHETTEKVFAAMEKPFTSPRDRAPRPGREAVRLRAQLRGPLPQPEGGAASLPLAEQARASPAAAARWP